MNEKDRDDSRRRLLEEKQAFRDQTAAGAASSATVELDQTRAGRLARMDAMQAQAMATAGGARVQHRLRLIDAALRRLDEDDIGDCRDCGEPIPAGRLDADPCAQFCVNCASARGG